MAGNSLLAPGQKIQFIFKSKTNPVVKGEGFEGQTCAMVMGKITAAMGMVESAMHNNESMHEELQQEETELS